MSSVELDFFPPHFLFYFVFFFCSAHSYLIFGGVTTTQLWIQLWFMTIIPNTEYVYTHLYTYICNRWWFGLCFIIVKRYRNNVFALQTIPFQLQITDPNESSVSSVAALCLWMEQKSILSVRLDLAAALFMICVNHLAFVRNGFWWLRLKFLWSLFWFRIMSWDCGILLKTCATNYYYNQINSYIVKKYVIILHFEPNDEATTVDCDGIINNNNEWMNEWMDGWMDDKTIGHFVHFSVSQTNYP